MVVSQDANADPFKRRQLAELRNVDVVEILHPDRFFVGTVPAFLTDADRNTRLLQPGDGLVGEAAALVAPETDAHGEFLQVVPPSLCRQCGEQEIHILLPRQSFRQTDGLPPCDRAFTIVSREIDSVHPAHHFTPRIGIDGPVQRETRNGRRDKRTGDPLVLERHPGLVKKIVQPVIRPAELPVRGPNVRRQPVVNRIGIANIIRLTLPDPPLPPETMLVAGAVDTPPTVVTLLGADSDQATSPPGPLAAMQPQGKTALEFVVPHLRRKKRKIFARIGSGGHFPHPQLPFALLPRPPIGLEHRCAGRHFKRHADAVYFENIGIRGQHLIDVGDRIAVLYLIIHMENADFPVESVPADVIDA